MNTFFPSLYLLAQETSISAASGDTAAAAKQAGGNSWQVWLAALIMLLGSFMLADFLSKAWRMKDHRGKFFTLIFAVAFGAVMCIAYFKDIKLGIDLVGGVELIYEIDTTKESQSELLPADIDAVRKAVGEITPDATVEVTPGRDDQFVIKLKEPSQSTIENIARVVSRLPLPGKTLERGTQTSESIVYDMRKSVAQEKMTELVERLQTRIDPGGTKEIKVRAAGPIQVQITIPQTDEQDLSYIKDRISTAGKLEFLIVADGDLFPAHKKLVELAMDKDRYGQIDNYIYDDTTDEDGHSRRTPIGRWVTLKGDKIISDARNSSRWKTRFHPEDPKKFQALCYHDSEVVTGDDLSHANGTTDQFGHPAVGFNFNGAGTRKFGKLTSKYDRKGSESQAKLGIVLDDELRTAPNLNEPITGGSGIISGVRADEIPTIVSILNDGQLKIALTKKPISEQVVSAELGEKTIQSGSRAMIISTIVVLVFMLMYYRFCGLVADLAVILNIVLVIALMIQMKAAFTLAGLAGLVLSVGMAVDANVLIYERMREELARGSALRMAIRNGFSRAMSTVIDSNLTTLISAVVLFAIGTAQLKGFATTLILGLVLNLFTAVYCARILFDVAEKRGWITRLSMMRMIGTTKIDFVKPVKVCVAVSCVLIAIGLGMGIKRGTNFLDIDFNGGTSVQMNLKEGVNLTKEQVTETVAKRIEDPDVTEVIAAPNSKQHIFKIVTPDADSEGVKKKLSELFDDKLLTYSMNYSNLLAIESTKAGETTNSSADAKTPGSTDVKAAETKSLDNKDAAKDATAPKADAAKTPDDKSSSAKPATETKTTVPDAKSADPKPPATAPMNKQSRNRSPRLGLQENAISMVGMTNGLLSSAPWVSSPVLSMAFFADETTLKPEDKKTDDKKTEEKKSDVTKAEEKPAAENQSSDAKPVEKKPDDAKTVENKTTATTPVLTKGPVDNRFKSKVTLEFDQKISKEAAQDLMASALRARKITVEASRLEVDPVKPVDAQGRYRYVYSTSLPPDELKKAVEHVKEQIDSTPYFSQATKVSGVVADNAKSNAVLALAVSMLAIVLYVWFRFQNLVFGFAAVIALVHDVLITVGALAVSSYITGYLPRWMMIDEFKISLEVVAALLTIVGFSINDTIVIFDRVREIKGKSPNTTKQMINQAVNETLGRTILTSGTVLLVTIILFFFGGESIHPFSFAMLIGLISGTYSTVYIAAPIVLWFKPRRAANAAESSSYGRQVMSSKA